MTVRTRQTRNRISSVVATVMALSLVLVGIAVADTVVNDVPVVASVKQATIVSAGTGVTVKYRITHPEDPGDAPECDANTGGSNKVVVTPTLPPGITATPATAEWTSQADCENGAERSITFTSSTLGAHTIDHSVAWTPKGGTRTMDISQLDFLLNVNPRPASGLTATAPSTDADTSIDVAWTRSPDHANITSYIVTRNGTPLAAMAADPAAGTSQGFTDTGLNASTEYCYTVKARYSSGGVDHDSTLVPVSPATVCLTTAAAPSTQTASFRQPIDGNGVVNIAKLGRTIPVKVTVDTGDESTGAGNVSIRWARTSACTSATATDTVEVYSSGGSNLGNQFRWEPTDGQWMFNLNTRDLGSTGCYRGFVYAGGTPVGDVISDGTKIGEFILELRK